MTEKTRMNLGKAIGELLESFIEFDKDKVVHLKIGLEALYNAQKQNSDDKRINLYAVCDHQLLHNLLEEHGIKHHDFAKVPEILQYVNEDKSHLNGLPEPLKVAIENVHSKQYSHYEVPSTGMVAVMFNMINDRVKNALVAGQAGERTLRAIERSSTASNIAVLKEMAWQDTLYDFNNKHQLARPYIGSIDSEPAYLVSAKATNHLAELFESSVSIYPLALEFDDTSNVIRGFNRLAASIFNHASINLDMAKAEKAAQEIRVLANYFSSKESYLPNAPEACKAIESGMQNLRKRLRLEGIITEKESGDYEALLNNRMQQIRMLENV